MSPYPVLFPPPPILWGWTLKHALLKHVFLSSNPPRVKGPWQHRLIEVINFQYLIRKISWLYPSNIPSNRLLPSPLLPKAVASISAPAKNLDTDTGVVGKLPRNCQAW